jgi:hypothetical protein
VRWAIAARPNVGSVRRGLRLSGGTLPAESDRRPGETRFLDPRSLGPGNQFLLGIEFLGQALWAEYVGDYVLAIGLGLVFQYYAIAPMRQLGLRDGLVVAAKADFWSLTAFEVGLFGWMALQALVVFPAPTACIRTAPSTGSGCRSACVSGSSPPTRSTCG